MTNKQSLNLTKYFKQVSEFIKAIGKIDVKITCGICGIKTIIHRLYRCYMCGLYICEKCAPKHFGTGKRPTIFNKEDNNTRTTLQTTTGVHTEDTDYNVT